MNESSSTESLPRWVWVLAISLIVIGLVYLTFQPKVNKPVVSQGQAGLINQATTK